MGAIDNFLKRRGYAKLDRYGLVLTPDDRVLSTRPAVLDDGLGSKIVGWVDGDLAAMELDKWAPAAMPAAAKTVAVTGRLQSPERPKTPTQRPLPGVAPKQTAPVAVVPAPMVAPAPIAVAPAPAPIAAPPAPVRSPLPAAMAAPAPAPVDEDDEAEWERIRAKMSVVPAAPVPRAPVVAAEPELTEDEWEWEIAMARSRAAAEDVQQSAAAMQFTKPKASPKTMQMAAVSTPSKAAQKAYAAKPFMASSPKTMPLAAVAAPKKPEPMPEWPKTEPLHESWEQQRTEATAPAHEAAPVKRSTVIPVPQLPVAARPSDVRPPPSSRTISPRTRVARGTGREDTVQIHAAPPSNDDTSPYLTIPTEVRSTASAHTKRAAAKHR